MTATGTAAGGLPCSACHDRAGTPCRPSPESDHYARWIARQNGSIDRRDLSHVAGQLARPIVWALVPVVITP